MKPTHVMIIPVREVAQGSQRVVQICLITSRASGEWLVPKGWREQRAADRAQAEREAFEEAGLLGKVIPMNRSAKLKAVKKGKKRHCKLYLMDVQQELERWPEQHQRQRQWVPIDQLHQHLSSKQLTKLVRKYAA
ncbi:NUDIX hydrolase [Aliagarivorans marinus]|uniref:NUDIX hydrolase n=1 Tax=Aliagarivorans marinus TaxID=561965 RepID=UPI00041EBDB4|nr:NUDIX domain-containing protein [Aliagarivorans marinus]